MIKRSRRLPIWRALSASLGLVLLSACGGRLPASRLATAAPTPSPGALRLLVEPQQGLTPIYSLLRAAHTSIDLTMYELADARVEALLDAAAARGVAVRVVLDTNRERAANTAAYDSLRAHGVRVVWADARYEATHEKAVVVDGAVAVVMTLNFTSRYYSSTRDFAVLDRQPADVAAVAKVFDTDFRHGRISPPHGADLVWSPGSKATLLALVASASSSLLVENEEMALPVMTSALERAERRGVRVTVVMTSEAGWARDFDDLTAAGVSVRVFGASASPYIHAKAIVVDAGTPRARAFVGSENFSAASLDHNRELGIVTADPGIVGTLASTVRADANAARGWASGSSQARG